MTDSSTQTITIATRKSPLALWQAETIRDALLQLHPDIAVELLPMSTHGDKILDAPLAKIGGKGLFVKELEAALLDGRADIAVHSTKDVPMVLPEGLALGVICDREDPLDALVLPVAADGTYSTIASLDDLPMGATVGTSSLRRQCQLQQLRPDIHCESLRGNVNTRLAKLDDGQYDAIILAAAGLRRLGFSDRISYLIEPQHLLPAVAQGALSIELRSGDEATQTLLEPLHHFDSAICVLAERAMNCRLQGGCQVPIAGFAQLSEGNHLSLEGRVGAIDGSELLIEQQQIILSGDNSQRVKQAEQLGEAIADRLLAGGARALLDQAYDNQ
jgi:hydroxymethylbilane synthase